MSRSDGVIGGEVSIRRGAAKVETGVDEWGRVVVVEMSLSSPPGVVLYLPQPASTESAPNIESHARADIARHTLSEDGRSIRVDHRYSFQQGVNRGPRSTPYVHLIPSSADAVRDPDSCHIVISLCKWRCIVDSDCTQA